jgi:putative membrane protein insertion efficiency factor
MRRISIFLIHLYRTALSPFLGDHCRFYPSCSCYAQEAIATHGVLKGSGLAVHRLSKCHPWHEGGVDLVPPCPHSP